MKGIKKFICALLVITIVAANNLIGISAKASVLSENVAVNINGQEIVFNEFYGYPYVDSNSRTQVPIRIVSEAYGIKVEWDDTNKQAILEKNNIIIKVPVAMNYIIVNGVKKTMDTITFIKNDRIYLPIRYIMEEYGCDVRWDGVKRVVYISDLPIQYDLRHENRITAVKNQYDFGTCWAFATLASLESFLSVKSYYDFSEDHLSLNTGYNITQTGGGNSMMAMASLLAWKGPVLEWDDPYGDGVTDPTLPSEVHVQGYEVIPNREYYAIKQAIIKYGAVQTSMYMPLTGVESDSSYYNKKTASLYYDGVKRQNHDVVIVGWDDLYSRYNFNEAVRPEINGAFICKNSWGHEFGEFGYFYVSYATKQFALNNVVFTRVDEVDNYSNIYQSDILGWVSSAGYGNKEAYFSNVYRPTANEELRAVGFYATDKNLEYEVYICREFVDEKSLNNRELITSGKMTNTGYYTVDLQVPILLEANKDFAVIVKAITPTPSYQIAVEYKYGSYVSSFDKNAGRGYRSKNGEVWDNVEENLNAHICLKAYTSIVEQ